MQNLLRPFVLRRLKTEVASQLAPKQHRLHTVPMTPSQGEQYAKAVADLRKNLGPKKAAAGEDGVSVDLPPPLPPHTDLLQQVAQKPHRVCAPCP